MKDVQAKGEASSPQKIASSASKISPKPSTENSYHVWFPRLSFIRILSSSISKKFEKTIFWTWSGSVLFSLWDPYPGKNVWNWNPEKFLCIVW